MTESDRLRRRLTPLSLFAIAALSACGGGGGEREISVTAQQAAPTPTAESASTPSSVSLNAAAASDPETTGPTAADLAPPTPEVVTAHPNVLEAAGSAQQSSDAAPLAAEPMWPNAHALAAVETLAGGNIYYVDNRYGSDANDGKSQSTASSGRGPWQSLAKAMAALNPGDTLRMVCGGSWNETLRPGRSGTAAAPIVIASYPAGCSTPAAIDGSTYIAATAWTRHANNIYRATLATKPLQLNNDAGILKLAHHPNRGFDSSRPTSLYLRNAQDSAVVTVNGRQTSSYLTTGSDLALPAGASLPAGTSVRVRTNAWTIDESTIASVSGTRVTLTTPTRYPLKAGWGYYLLGQLWMLDSAGEWHWDPASRTVYAWMPNSSAPAGMTRATTREIGVNLDNLQHVTIDGLWVRTTGVGISAKASTGVAIMNARIDDTAGVGIDMTDSSSPKVASTSVSRTGGDAIVAVGSNGATISGNKVYQSGVQFSNGSVATLPRSSRAAILGGWTSAITNNAISDSSYNGISTATRATITGNVVSGACSVLDDGAGIYTHGSGNSSLISDNIIQNVRGNVDGKGSSPAVTQAQGIYLDEYADNIVVRNNTVINADNGIQIHVSPLNTITNNKLYGNRVNQIWMQENTNAVRATGDMYGNTLNGNQFVPTSSTASGFTQETTIQNTTLFGQYDNNVYFDRVYARIGVEKVPASVVEYTIGAWKAATYADGSPRLQDPNGLAASSVRYASSVVSGVNLVPNPSVAQDLTGWTSWSQSAPYGVLSRAACDVGFCARYVAGASEGLVSSPNFSIVKDQWYRIAVDVQGSVDGQVLNVVLRRGGGGTNGYEPLSSMYAYVPIARSWKRLTFTVKATKTVNARDPVTRDLGARIDFAAIKPGQMLQVSGVEMVPVTMPTSSTRTDILVNPSAQTQLLTCPTAQSVPAMCARYHRLSDNQTIVWPYSVPARGSEIIYTLDPTLVDSDVDGIADTQDSCGGTSAGATVNSRGCSLWQ